LKARFDYLVGQPRYDELIRDVDFQGVCVHSLASTLVAKINALVIAEEDRKLAAAIKKMDLDKPAVEAAAQAPSNELSELKKLVVDLGKKVDLVSKKVSNNLYSLLCVCAGHLMLTPPLLETLVNDTVQAGWEEVERQEGQGEERKDRAKRKEKGRKSQSRRGEIQGKGQRQGWRFFVEGKDEGQQEEGWQEVGATFLLSFVRTDSGFSFGFGFWYRTVRVFGFVWFGLDLLTGDMRFLCMSSPPSILLNCRLAPLVQFCCLVFSISTTMPKYNIFDYTTYPHLSTLVEQDLLFLVTSRFAPQWLLGSRRFTNSLHSNLEIAIPDKVVGTFSAGLKYISPIAMKKSLVKESWNDFCDRAYRSWDSAHLTLTESDLEKLKETTDPFYLIPVPFNLKGRAAPYEGLPTSTSKVSSTQDGRSSNLCSRMC
jgi:hypothetical protein